jgi:hypothetical protein
MFSVELGLAGEILRFHLTCAVFSGSIQAFVYDDLH